MIENWDALARHLLQRLSREHLLTGRASLAQLLTTLRAYPGVPHDFRVLDAAFPVEPVFDIQFRVQGLTIRFLTTLTSFNAPQSVTLDELRIESFFPIDEQTAKLCEVLGANV